MKAVRSFVQKTEEKDEQLKAFLQKYDESGWTATEISTKYRIVLIIIMTGKINRIKSRGLTRHKSIIL